MGGARLRRLRHRFGIAAPQVAVRTQVPWYLRWALLALFVGASVALAAWMYDTGRRYAGFDRSEAAHERERLRRELAAATKELAELRGVANAADAKLAIERSAQQKLAQQIRQLEAENARLREELAIFESMLAGGGARTDTAVLIQRFKVEPDLLPGEYRYRLLLVAPGTRRSDFQGRYELVLHLNEKGRDVRMTLPEAGEQAGAQRLAFRRFQRLEGLFRIPPAARLEQVQVRVYEEGVSQVRASHTVRPG